MSSDSFLDAATAIGREIVASAIWSYGVCNWVGVAADPKDVSRREYRALGPSLYDGTAGVGLFLAALAAITDDAKARRTAVGALRHAVVRAPAHRAEGFHAGSLGIAWAAEEAGAWLGEQELRASAHELPRRAAPVPDGCPDVLLGAAGSAVARLALARMFDDADLAGDAVATGEGLVASAVVTAEGWSWESPAGQRLCGLSHGAGGIGWALLELFAATGDGRFKTAAEGAFAYERSWLDAQSGSWPDLRLAGQRRRGRHEPSATIGSWCHGEAGIALTRLRAIEVLGDGPHVRDAEVALATTRRELAAAVPFDVEDLTLCHGAAGAADVLLVAGGFPEPWELGRAALDRHAAGARWPCGMLGGTTPNLFRGLAGIGWLYLRLHDAAVPSPVSAPIRLTPSASRG